MVSRESGTQTRRRRAPATPARILHLAARLLPPRVALSRVRLYAATITRRRSAPRAVRPGRAVPATMVFLYSYIFTHTQQAFPFIAFMTTGICSCKAGMRQRVTRTTPLKSNTVSLLLPCAKGPGPFLPTLLLTARGGFASYVWERAHHRYLHRDPLCLCKDESVGSVAPPHRPPPGARALPGALEHHRVTSSSSAPASLHVSHHKTHARTPATIVRAVRISH